jgi:hypothetical protein
MLGAMAAVVCRHVSPGTAANDAAVAPADDPQMHHYNAQAANRPVLA